MTLHLLQPTAERHWSKTDKVMHRLSRANPLPEQPPIDGDDGFAALVHSIIHQQVSLAAGRTISANTVKLLGGKVTPRRVLNRAPEQLRGAGLSRAKAAYILDLADKTLRGDVEFARFPEMGDSAIVEELVQVNGIGVWTAKMFLMFHLQRPDVLAPEDLGLRIAVANAYGIDPDEAADFMAERHPQWSPYCSVAARVLWQSRRSPV
jgi:DNA-3-methyladenine glycosylase II